MSSLWAETVTEFISVTLVLGTDMGIEEAFDEGLNE